MIKKLIFGLEFHLQVVPCPSENRLKAELQQDNSRMKCLRIRRGVLMALLAVGLPCAVHATSRGANGWAEPERVGQVARGEIRHADARWWGFDAEDSTRYLQAALDSGAETLLVPAMESPWIVEPLFIHNDNLEVVFEPGAVLEAKRGAFRGRNDALLRMNNRSNIRLLGYGAEFRMHKQDYWEAPYQRSEWRHALDIRGSTGIHIEGLSFLNSGGDGIYLGATSENRHVRDVVIRAVWCNANNRQGLSVISAENLLVENSVFSNTIGTSPMAGIDLEPNRPDQLMKNIVIRNNLFLNNSQLGMHIWLSHLDGSSQPVSITVENNSIRGGEIGIHVARFQDDGPGGFVEIRGNTVDDTHFAGIMLRRISATSGIDLRFSDNVLYNTAHNNSYSEEIIAVYRARFGITDPALWWGNTGSPSAPVVITAQQHLPRRQGGVSFNGDTVFHSRESPAVVVSGPWDRKWTERFANESESPAADEFIGWSHISGTIRVVSPAEAMQLLSPLNDFNLEIIQSFRNEKIPYE